MTDNNDFPVLAYKFASDNSVLYVSALPGEGGADWGFTTNPKGHNGLDKAKPLSRYWWQRFAKNERDCGRCAFCVPA